MQRGNAKLGKLRVLHVPRPRIERFALDGTGAKAHPDGTGALEKGTRSQPAHRRNAERLQMDLRRVVNGVWVLRSDTSARRGGDLLVEPVAEAVLGDLEVVASLEVEPEAFAGAEVAGEVKQELLDGINVTQDQVYRRTFVVDFFVSLLGTVDAWADRTLAQIR